MKKFQSNDSNFNALMQISTVCCRTMNTVNDVMKRVEPKSSFQINKCALYFKCLVLCSFMVDLYLLMNPFLFKKMCVAGK